MIRSLQIKRFKAWADTGQIHLAPLTVFFGTNSSGKSSIGQLLLLLKQTAESADRRQVLNPGDKSSVVDLGTYSDFVFRHDEKAGLEFSLRWDLPTELPFTDTKSKQRYRASDITFSCEIGATGGDVAPHVRRMEYLLKADPNQVRFEMLPLTDRPSRYELSAEGYHLVRERHRAWHLPAPDHFYGFPDEALAYYQNTAFLADLNLELERMLQRLYYVGPLRMHPDRLYTWSGETPEHVGWRGERAVDALLAARQQGRQLSREYKKKRRPFDVVIATWLQQLGLIHEFSVVPIGRGRKEHEVKIRVAAGSAEVLLPDVGFGISQVLPVLVECFYAPHDSTIVFEQPEIHLHPRAQSALADMMIEATTSRDEEGARNTQLIVESHSEHFLRRLQRRIAEQDLDSKQVALYFCHQGPDGSELRELDLDLFGQVTNWPPGFFGDIAGDVRAQTMAMVDRMSAGNGQVHT